jgi:hypothetical protein
MLLRLAAEARVFCGSDNRFYAQVPAGSHHEVYDVESAAFAYWLIRLVRRAALKVPGAESINRLVRTLQADAAAQGSTQPVWVRVADGSAQSGSPPTSGPDSQRERAAAPDARAVYYLDLGDWSWRAVEITAQAWRIVERPPVLFRRPRGMRPLPSPQEGGAIDLLKKYANLADADFPLLLGWLTAALRPAGPYPILILSGEQGSAKSTMARLLRKLIDPNAAEIRGLSGGQQDFHVEAYNTWVIAYDNVNRLSAAFSDALCRTATGGGYSTRSLYSNDDETLFDIERPMILTGIDDFVRRGDLADRCVFLHLPRIRDQNRRLEKAL